MGYPKDQISAQGFDAAGRTIVKTVFKMGQMKGSVDEEEKGIKLKDDRIIKELLIGTIEGFS
jgi:hypothetical protein